MTKLDATAGAHIRKAQTGALLLGLRGVLVEGLTLLTTVWLARTVSIEDFGVYAVLVALVAFAGVALLSGFASFLLREGDRELKAALGIAWMCSILAAAATVSLGIASEHPMIWTGLAVYVLSLPPRLPRGVALTRSMNFIPLARAHVIEAILLSGGVLLVTFLGLSIQWCGLVLAVAGVVSTLALVGSGFALSPRISWRTTRSLLSSSRSDHLQFIVDAAVISCTVPLISVVSGDTVAGQIRWGLLLASPSLLLLGFIAPAVFSALVSLGPVERPRACRRLVWLVTLPTALYIACVLPVLDQVSALLGGHQWDATLTSSRILVVSTGITCIGLLLRLILQASERPRVGWAARLVAWAGCVVIGSLFLPVFGVSGIAVAILVASILWCGRLLVGMGDIRGFLSHGDVLALGFATAVAAIVGTVVPVPSNPVGPFLTVLIAIGVFSAVTASLRFSLIARDLRSVLAVCSTGRITRKSQSVEM